MSFSQAITIDEMCEDDVDGGTVTMGKSETTIMTDEVVGLRRSQRIRRLRMRGNAAQATHSASAASCKSLAPATEGKNKRRKKAGVSASDIKRYRTDISDDDTAEDVE